jgi:hypothetical protein
MVVSLKIGIRGGAKDAVYMMSWRMLLAEFAWAFVREALGWNDYPRSMRELLSHVLQIFHGLSIKKMFLENPINAIYNALSYV